MRQAAEAAKRQHQLQQETQFTQPVEENSASMEEKTNEAPPEGEVQQTEQNLSSEKIENPTTSDLPAQVEQMGINVAEEKAI